MEFRGPVTRALAAVLIDEIGHAFTCQQLRRGGDFEVQMRFSSISGIADECQSLPAPHAIPYYHAQTSRLQMQVICELAATQVECDCIARHCFQRNWHGRVERVAVPGDVIGKAVPCCNDALLFRRSNRSERPASHQRMSHRA